MVPSLKGRDLVEDTGPPGELEVGREKGSATFARRVAEGRVHNTRFSVALESRYLPAVNGVAVVKQSMRGEHVGPCKVALMKVITVITVGIYLRN